MMTRAKTILILFAASGLAAGCSTAFADFNDGAPQSAAYPDFADLPPPPETTALDPRWAERTERVIASRDELVEGAQRRFPTPAADPEAVAEEARRRTEPQNDQR